MLEKIVSLINSSVGEDSIIDSFDTEWERGIQIIPEKLKEVCLLLRDNENTYFDMLACITGIDNLPEENSLEVIYNLTSLPYNYSISLKVKLERENENGTLPIIDSVADTWATANWLEREVYDLLGISFSGHPDLRRILLPTDWKGYPLRKDYQLQEYYHGVKVEY
jgi:NADH-quinone oxidoreductase subunit C